MIIGLWNDPPPFSDAEIAEFRAAFNRLVEMVDAGRRTGRPFSPGMLDLVTVLKGTSRITEYANWYTCQTRLYRTPTGN